MKAKGAASLKRRAKAWRRALAQATRRWRTLPDYLILGAQKGGTSSLYNYLCKHPDVASATIKEIHYFTHWFDNGEAWYRGHFSMEPLLAARQRLRGRRPLSGESSPDYLFNPLAPPRAAALLPHARHLVLLRNPVDRAFSHYRHRIRKGIENRSFEAAIAEEMETVASDIAKGQTREFYDSFDYVKRSYLTRGLYSRQLRPWFAAYARDRFLLMRSEELFEDSRAVYLRVLDFLGLPQWQPTEMGKFNSFSESRIPAGPRRRLEQFFEPYNEELAELTGITI
jgi:hypothetical protein